MHLVNGTCKTNSWFAMSDFVKNLSWKNGLFIRLGGWGTFCSLTSYLITGSKFSTGIAYSFGCVDKLKRSLIFFVRCIFRGRRPNFNEN